jgi:hypothetical protein
MHSVDRQMKIYLPVVVLRLRSQGPAGGAAGLRVNSQLPLALNGSAESEGPSVLLQTIYDEEGTGRPGRVGDGQQSSGH